MTNSTNIHNFNFLIYIFNAYCNFGLSASFASRVMSSSTKPTADFDRGAGGFSKI